MVHGLSFTFLISVYLYVHMCAGTCLYADEYARVCIVYDGQGTSLAVITQMPFTLFLRDGLISLVLSKSGWLASNCCNQLESLVVNVPSGFLLKQSSQR